MKIEFTIDGPENIDVVIARDSFTGSFTLRENGNEHIVKSALNPLTHFNIKLTKEYEVEVGTLQKHIVKIVHTRPLFLAGFRPQKYLVTVDGVPAAEYEGY